MNIAQALSELDLRPGATEQEIRSAYRTLAAKWHPDKHQNDPISLRVAAISKAKIIVEGLLFNEWKNVD